MSNIGIARAINNIARIGVIIHESNKHNIDLRFDQRFLP
jgi:hypothetical protein